MNIQLHYVWDHCVDCRQRAISLSSASFCHILSHSPSCTCFCFSLILQSINIYHDDDGGDFNSLPLTAAEKMDLRFIEGASMFAFSSILEV